MNPSDQTQPRTQLGAGEGSCAEESVMGQGGGLRVDLGKPGIAKQLTPHQLHTPNPEAGFP